MKTIVKERKKQAEKILIDRINIPDYVENIIVKHLIKKYLNKNKSLNNGKIFCPFHDEVNEPSFSYKKEDKIAYCFGCKRGGNVIALHMYYLNLILKQKKSYEDAMIDLAQLYHITIPEFMVDEKSSTETIKNVIIEKISTKRRKLKDIMKSNVVTLNDVENINKNIVASELQEGDKLKLFEYLDKIMCISENIKITKEELIQVLKFLGGLK